MQPLGGVPRGSFAGFRSDFMPPAFTQAIESKGYRCRWEKSILCANRGDEDLDRHKLTCSVCHGGFIYYDPQTVEVLMTSLSIKEFYRTEGRFDVGTVLVTLTAENRIGVWDRLTMLDSRMRYSEVLRRGAGLVDRLKYPALDVEKLYAFTGVNKTTDYLVDVDFTINTDGNIQWINPPGKDVALGVNYYRTPAYIILDLAHHIRDTQVAPSGVAPPAQNGAFTQMPMQGMAKLDYLVLDEALTK
jgi:hypothetical protein